MAGQTFKYLKEILCPIKNNKENTARPAYGHKDLFQDLGEILTAGKNRRTDILTFKHYI
jgi:hypothetical protein